MKQEVLLVLGNKKCNGIWHKHFKNEVKFENIPKTIAWLISIFANFIYIFS